MNINFEHIKLNNFCGLKEFESDLYGRTLVKGINKSGKSTIKNAIYWLLTDKLADGREPSAIRPIDKDGNLIDFIDVEGTLDIDIDGKKISIHKVYSQNWVKNKTTLEQEFKGNETTYEINGIPKKKSDFVDYISQYVDINNLLFCMNPLYFLKMNSKERRSTLFSFCKDADNDVIDSDKRFEALKSDLQDGTVDELIARSKGTIKRCNERIKVLPDLITQEESHIIELSDEEVAMLRKELADEEKKITKYDSIASTSEELSKRIADAKVELEKLNLDERLAVQKAEANANLEKQNLTQAIAMARGTILQIEKNIENAKLRMSDIETCIKGYAETIKEIKAETFDDTNLMCPVCGSKYTKAKVEKMREAWEENQNNKLADFAHMETDSESQYQQIESDVAKWEEEIKAQKSTIESQEKELAVLETMPVPVDKVDNSKEKAKLSKNIDKWSKELEELNLSSGTEKQVVLEHIKDINIKLNALTTNKAFKDNVSTLKAELLEKSQQVADEEKYLDLLTLYQRAKIGKITDEINSYFEVITWRFFRQQINGDYAEVCEPLVDGISLDGLLNRGDSILAMADLCKAFQKKADIEVPLLLDDCESVDGDRLPKASNQLIFFRRTDDKNLTIEDIS